MFDFFLYTFGVFLLGWHTKAFFGWRAVHAALDEAEKYRRIYKAKAEPAEDDE